MTLIVTEISSAGIAMAADSTICFVDSKGKLLQQKNNQNWTKLLKVEKITAVVSYWGTIGRVTKERFDDWLNRIIQNESYDDIDSFADLLCAKLNAACNNKPLADNECMGIHLAGFKKWIDDVERPFFYHIHNGHGYTKINNTIEESNGIKYIASVSVEWKSEKRELFSKHQDFPSLSHTLPENLNALSMGYTTRNGDYLIFSAIAQQIQSAVNYINLIPGVCIPRNPDEIGPRRGYLHIMVQMIISIYRCSSLVQVIGGTVTSLGISAKTKLYNAENE